MKKIRNRQLVIIWMGLFAISMGLLFLKCRYGFPTLDEYSLVAVMDRFVKGDFPVSEEWFIAYYGMYFFAPLERFAAFISGYSTYGLIFWYRVMSMLVLGIGGVYTFLCLKKYSFASAIFTSLALILWTQSEASYLSYSSGGLLLLFLAALMFHDGGKHVYFSGMLFAVAVLCCPLLVIVYIYIIFQTIKNRHYVETFYSRKKFVCLTLGIASVAVFFLIIVFKRLSWIQIKEILMVVLGGAEHRVDLAARLKEYGKIIIIGSPLLLLCGFSKILDQRYYIYLRVVGLLETVIAMLLFSGVIYMRPEHEVVSLAFLALLFKLTDKTDCFESFWNIWMWGVIYAIVINFVSNTGSVAIASASYMSGLTLFIVVGKQISQYSLCMENVKTKNIERTSLLIGMIAILGILFYSRMIMVAPYHHMSEQVTEVEDGYVKGIYGIDSDIAQYNKEYTNAKSLIDDNLTKNKKILSYGNNWVYLSEGVMCSAFELQQWSSISDETLEKAYDLYYKINPEKYPDLVYIENMNEKDERVLFFEKYFKSRAEKKYGGYVIKVGS